MNKTLKKQIMYGSNDPSSYYGKLSSFDFNGHQTMKSMSDKIIQDWNFDRRCRKNAELRDRMKEENKREKS